MKQLFKRERYGWLPVLTYIVLVLLMVIQVGWIFKAARLEEQIFSHRVEMALKAARDEIGVRIPQCSDMSDFLCGRPCPRAIHIAKTREVDSIINTNLRLWNIELPYQFQLTDSFLHLNKHRTFNSPAYHQNLSGLLDQSGVMIEVEFPTRNQFLVSQIYGILGLSVIFIVFVMFSFLIMMRLLGRDKALLVHTTDFINNMVHEFQTPIANVRFASQLINKNCAAGETNKTSEYAGVILDETLRLQQLVEEILHVGRPETDDEMTEGVDVHAAIRQAVEPFLYRVQASGGKLRLGLTAQRYLIRGEYGPMVQVVSNLIDNALKYVDDVPVIMVNTVNKDNRLVVSVTDNGIGIHKNEQMSVFEKYYRVSTGNTHNVKGFGLGLTYVKKVVTRFGGSVAVVSQPAKGSTFRVILPLT
ncbi:sensor histidine kinase [Geofilum sp. OHC36d9]|uniref:sensor histidine kinase n=1 Tax=Geofilum sp. OHC36d9 TaxID=3458413 RepID=UPI0040344426